MSSEPDAETEDLDWERPVVFPMFDFPTRLATPVTWALMASAMLAIIAALVNAISYRHLTPAGGVTAPGVRISQPSIGFADRVALFANGAGTLTVALLVVVTVTIVCMATRHGEVGSVVNRGRALLVAACAIGSVVVLANVAKAIVILSNATGQFTAELSDNKISNILALLPPALGAAAALMYALNRVRNAPEPPRPGVTKQTLGTDT
jgi:hypothetical protein